MKSCLPQRQSYAHRKGGANRKVWAIKHRLGVSLIQGRSGASAAKRAQVLMGEMAGPYEVLRNQDHEIAWARAMGAKIL